jgi:hypothetical protein
MTPPSSSASIDVAVDVDAGAALTVRTFLATCLRRQAK